MTTNTLYAIITITVCALLAFAVNAGRTPHHLEHEGPPPGECYTQFRFGIDALVHGDEAADLRAGAAQLRATLDLCFPPDGDRPRPSSLLTGIDRDHVVDVVRQLESGWSDSVVGSPWRGVISPR